MLSSLHIVTGALALLFGVVAFTSRKGAFLHKKSGLFFVIAMLLMTSSAMVLAAANAKTLSLIAGCLTFYLVATAFLTVHSFKQYQRIYLVILMCFGLIVGIFGLREGIQILAAGSDTIDGKPVQVLLVFSSIALIGSIFDLRVIYSGSLKGKQRLIRHIWRIGLAMLIATASFFLGQAQVIPEAIRSTVLLVTPVLLVILLTLFWLIRIQFWGLKKRA